MLTLLVVQSEHMRVGIYKCCPTFFLHVSDDRRDKVLGFSRSSGLDEVA